MEIQILTIIGVNVDHLVTVKEVTLEVHKCVIGHAEKPKRPNDIEAEEKKENGKDLSR